MQLIFQGEPLKEIESTKESSKPERPIVITKRSTQAAAIQHKKPASSVDAQVIGGSTLSSQAIPKQEVSTASSKGSTLKTGMLLFPKKLVPICKSTYFLLSYFIMYARSHSEASNNTMLT